MLDTDPRDTGPRDTGPRELDLVAETELDADAWRDRATRAAVRLALEEDLTGQARARGRQLHDEDRRELVTWLRRHRHTTNGRLVEWEEVVTAHGGPHRVRVTRVAVASRPGD